MMLQAVYNIVDSYFVAKISEDAMTALSLVSKKEATHQNDVWRKSELYSGKIHFPDGFSGYIVPSVSHICQWFIELFYHLC